MAIKRVTLAAFTAPCLPIAALGLPVVVYLPPYYASHLGLSLSAVGTIFLLVRLIDVPLDPFFGHMIDRTRTRFGRFRPWFAIGALLLMFGSYLVFMAAPGISAARGLAGLLVLYLGYSLIYLAHTAWGATLSDNYHERSRVFGWWQTGNLLGLVLVLMVPPLVLRLDAADGPAAGIHAMGWFIIFGLPVAGLLALALVPERARLGGHTHRLRDVAGVLRLPLLRRLLLIDLLANLGPGVAGALFLFFLHSARGYTAAESSLLLLFYFFAGLVAAPLWVRLARATSKHQALVIALISYAVLQAGIVLLPANDFTGAAVGIAVAGVPFAAAPFLLRAMLADVSDAETLRAGQESTGLFFAAITAVTKLGFAIPVGLIYPLLALIGFDAAAGTGNSAAALHGLTWLFAAPPALLALAAAWLAAGWPINAAEQARVAAALAER